MQDLARGLPVAFTLWVFAVGAVVGSFLNVVIARVPKGRSIVSPGSRCPRCGSPIAWYDNIPVLSWFLLRARCRNCSLPISPRYPLVELLTGVLAVAVVRRVGPSWTAVGYFDFAATLVALAYIDLDTWLLQQPGVEIDVRQRHQRGGEVEVPDCGPAGTHPTDHGHGEHPGQHLDQRIARADGEATVAAAPAEQQPGEHRDVVVPGDRVTAARTAASRRDDAPPLRQPRDHHVEEAADHGADGEDPERERYRQAAGEILHLVSH